MIDISGLRLSFGERDIFKDVNLRVEDGERAALFGINGAGKSTLLKIIAGQLQPDAGEVATGRGETVGYLSQDSAEVTAEDGQTVFQFACRAFDELQSAHARCEEIEQRMSAGTATEAEFDEYGHLHDRLAVSGGWSFESQTAQVLSGLGFSEEMQHRELESYSGGWRMRAALARVLLKRPSILLLDEPTNHLDLESIMWLENHVRAMPATVLFISHDQSFVDNLSHRILELELGTVRAWPSPYAKFRAEKEHWLETLKNAYEKQQADIAQAERFIDRFKATSTKSSVAMSRQKQLAKVERIELPPEVSRVALHFPPPPDSGAYPFVLHGVSKAYDGDPVIADVELSVARGEKVALLGVNGAGKSTLLNILAQKFPPTSGEMLLGAKTDIGLFAQYDDLPEAEQDRSIGDILYDAAPTGTARVKIRTLLGTLLFSGDDADKRYRVLSGGEKARVRLGLMLLRPHNVLLLDEPTNHLDLQTRQAMAEALRDWAGTLLFVSHDRVFTRALAGRILAVGGGRVVDWPGTYDEYLAVASDGSAPGLAHLADVAAKHREVAAPPAVAGNDNASGKSGQLGRAAQQEERRRKRRVDDLEKKIDELDGRLAKIDEVMAAPGFFDDREKSEQKLAERRKIEEQQAAVWKELEALLE